jgi:HPt (histidine-containing phosphotransfer) domain-containing protein
VSERSARIASDASAASYRTHDDAIDEKALASLVEMTGNAALVHELIDVYLTDTAARVVTMREAAARGDSTTVRRVAHTLRGSSAGIGARGLASLGQHVEHAFATQSPDGAALLDRVAAEFARVQETLRCRQHGGDRA